MSRGMDPCRLLILLDCAAELVVFACFFWAYEVPRQNMISDTLFALPEYTIVLTMFLAFRVLFGAMYLYTRWRAEAHAEDGARLRNSIVATSVGFALALFGWAWLCAHTDDPNHLSGVGFFAAGSFVYSLGLVRVARLSDAHLRLDTLYFALDRALILVTVALACTFVGMWTAGQSATYIVEHVTYAADLVFWMAFFYFHWVGPGNRLPRATFHLPQQCQPLLPLVDSRPG